MDDREDEQVRGITMKASAIALQFVHGKCMYNLCGYDLVSCIGSVFIYNR